METRKSKGYKAEALVGEWYYNQGRTICMHNYTIRGGEIDLIVENETYRCFIEVKSTTTFDDFTNIITNKKKRALKYAIYSYMHEFPTKKYRRIDIVFVKNNRIVHLFENTIL